MKKHLFLLALSLAGCGKIGASLSPLETAARDTCTNTIESRAIKPKSVSYLGGDPAMVKEANGQLSVIVKFSAKNDIGGASTMTAKCTLSPDGKTLVDIAVKEGR